MWTKEFQVVQDEVHGNHVKDEVRRYTSIERRSGSSFGIYSFQDLYNRLTITTTSFFIYEIGPQFVNYPKP